MARRPRGPLRLGAANRKWEKGALRTHYRRWLQQDRCSVQECPALTAFSARFSGVAPTSRALLEKIGRPLSLVRLFRHAAVLPPACFAPLTKKYHAMKLLQIDQVSTFIF